MYGHIAIVTKLNCLSTEKLRTEVYAGQWIYRMETIYRPGSLLAKGYKAGKKVMVEKIETTGEAARISIEPYNTTLKADGQDIAIVDLTLKDEKIVKYPMP